MNILSNSFNEGDFMPSKYTCEGKNISPELHWTNYPAETKSFALICKDPDAPGKTWIHWILFNIPSKINQLQEDFENKVNNEFNFNRGKNDFNTLNYGGPCPPKGHGVHNYIFTVYALKDFIALKDGVSISELKKEIEKLQLDKASINCKYKR